MIVTRRTGCGALLALALLGWAVLSGGCLPDDPAPVWVGPLPLDGGVCDASVYPCGSYGTAPCDVIEDLELAPANEPARARAGVDDVLGLRDLYADESVAGILLFGTAGWCQFCGQEGEWLVEVYDEYHDVNEAGQRVEIVAVVFQDDFGATATTAYAEAYAARRGFPFPAVADPSGGVLRYFDASAAPGNIFVSRADMRIQSIVQGFDQAAIVSGLRALDGTATCQ